MKRFSIASVIILLACLAPPAQTQHIRESRMISEARSRARVDAQVLFQAWRALQRQNSKGVQTISMSERIDSRFDGPAGSWHSTFDVSLSGLLDQLNWERNITGFRTDGKSMPRSEWDILSEQWKNLLGESFAFLIEDPALPLQLLENMRPAGDAQEEIFNRDRHWRIEMVPAKVGSLYQSVTLWVHKKVGYLSRTRAVTDSRRSSIVNVTDYRRVKGIDVPLSRTFEGKVQTRRRTRVTTVFFNVDAEFIDVSFR